MIAQGSNLPICFKNVPQSVFTAKDVSASIYSGKKLLKHWSKEELTFADGSIIAPLTQEETMGFPHGFVRVTLKYSDANGAIIPPVEINEVVGKRSDKTILSGEEEQLITSVDYDLTEVDLETGKVIFKGYSPYVGDNGNWFAYDDLEGKYIDTEIKVQGPEGKPYENSEEFSTLAKEVRENTVVAKSSAETATSAKNDARVSAQESLNYKESAKTYASNASGYATKAQIAYTNASDSEKRTKASETSASVSEKNALTYVGNASMYASEAKKIYNDIQKKVEDGTFKGEQGERGEDGKSAYEVAVDNGFIGDPFDFIESLKGQPGIDGTDGRDGTDGKDYVLTETDKEDIASKVHVEEKHVTEYVENPYNDSELREELTDAKEEIRQLNETKVGYSEVVDGQLLMYSDATKEHLLATLDLPQGGGISDVKIGDDSIVTDGVANIPQAKESGKIGAILVAGATQGLSFRSDGGLYVMGAKEADINRRDINRAIVTTNLNYAVTAVLTDGKAPALTEEQQESAQSWLGIYPMNEEGY